MDTLAELDRLTLELCGAAASEDLDPALELLAHRQELLDSLRPGQDIDMQPTLRRSEQAIAGLRVLRERWVQELNRLRQARGRLDSFRPARTPRRRLDLQM